VHSITIMIDQTYGDSRAIIYYLGFKGEGTGIRRGLPSDIVYESAPNISDHQVKNDGLNSTFHSAT